MKKLDKSFWYKLIIKLLIIAIVLVIDLLTKWYFAKIDVDQTLISGVLGFRYVENTGAAFGSFSNGTVWLIIFSIIFIGLFTWWDISSKEKSGWLLVGYSFVIGGAIGNLIDRIFLGYVRDFISVEFTSFAIFNFADTFITIGCICYIIYLIIYIVRTNKNKRRNDNG